MFKKKNFAKTLCAEVLAIAETDLTITTGEGVKFPDVGAGNTFRAVLWGAAFGTPESDPDREIVTAYQSATDVMTIVRAQESTTAKQWEIGDNFILSATAGTFEEIEAAITTAENNAIANALGKFWKDMPTPTRVSDTQFTIADAAGANGYASLFQKGTVLKWTNSGTKQAMVISASYATNVVTINIIGDAFAAGFSAMKYAMEKARTVQFAIPGVISAATDQAGIFYAPFDMKIFGADARVKTAGTTNATVFDINDDGTTMFTAKPSIASGATTDIDNTADTAIVCLEDSLITVDVDSVSTTAPLDAYLALYFAPNNNQYLV